MRRLVVGLIALMAALTLLALGLNDNEWATIPHLFLLMHGIS